jgi:hypothetical protein
LGDSQCILIGHVLPPPSSNRIVGPNDTTRTDVEVVPVVVEVEVAVPRSRPAGW